MMTWTHESKHSIQTFIASMISWFSLTNSTNLFTLKCCWSAISFSSPSTTLALKNTEIIDCWVRFAKHQYSCSPCHARSLVSRRGGVAHLSASGVRSSSSADKTATSSARRSESVLSELFKLRRAETEENVDRLFRSVERILRNDEGVTLNWEFCWDDTLCMQNRVCFGSFPERVPRNFEIG